MCLTTDARRARDVGRQLISFYFGLPNYRRMLIGCGFREDELDDGGSDRVIDQLLGWGDENHAFLQVWAGRSTWGDAMAADDLVLHGPGPLVRAFPSWFALSPFARPT